MYKLKVQGEKCSACGMCALESNILHEDSAGIVEVVGEGIVPDSEIEKIKRVVELCPTNALSLLEDSTNVRQKLAELRGKMQSPLVFDPPAKEKYEFSMEDRDEYAKDLWNGSRGGVSDEYEFDYKSSSSARSAGERAFREEIYSQADALAQQVIVMYEQRKMNRVARYAETNENYKYGVHQRLIRDLRSYVNDVESYTGKKISLPSGFFSFNTKDTESIKRSQSKANEWLAGRIKEHLESASEFYTCVKTDSTEDYVKVSSWFGDDDYKMVKKYAYYIDGEKLQRFYRHVARATWKAGKYTSQFCERELDQFHKEIEQEWKDKIAYISNRIGDNTVRENLVIEHEQPKPSLEEKPVQRSLPLHELKKILLESYSTPSIGESFAVAMFGNDKDKDYGDLWHIRNSGFFVDERFKKISNSDKEVALELICQGLYSEDDLVRIGVVLLDTDSREYRLYAKTTDDRFWGFALTKDSFCLKGLYFFSRENFIIPYGNIKEVQITTMGNLKIVFYKNRTETTDIVWDVKYADKFTFTQLCRYLNKVKNYYSPV